MLDKTHTNKMTKTKTKETSDDVEEFIGSFADTEQKRQDSFELLKLMQDLTGFEPKMWGSTIIGFGSYHYKYESGHEGDAPLVGFSPQEKRIFALCFYWPERTRTFAAEAREIQKRKSLYLCQNTF